MEKKDKILVIDDEKIFVENLAEVVEHRGYDVKMASSGEEAIVLAKEFLPDLILCDVSMDGMSGYEVLEELKKDETTFNIPFIFLTGKAEPVDIRKGMGLGADDYITKPFYIDDLFRAIEVRLNKHKKVSGFYESKILDIKQVVLKTLPHELRSPLNTILGYTQLIIARYDEFKKHEVIAMLSEVENSGRKLLRLITNYNFYNSLVSSPETILNSNKENVVYSSMILDTLPFEIASRYNRTNDLKTDVVNANLIITNECFSKIVEELTDNAFKFSKEGTTVEIKSHIKDNMYILEFIDKGEEMTEEEFMQIGAFEQFGREQKEQQGAGMGLAIVSQIMKLWNGQLKFTTKPGGIIIFSVSIPISDKEPTM